MWAAYQGDAISVDIFLKHGASIEAVDNAQMTPLHWAAVKGSKMCIQHLVEAGAELHAREAQGKTARDMAEELKGLAPWDKALEDAGGRRWPSFQRYVAVSIVVAALGSQMPVAVPGRVRSGGARTS